MQISVRLTVQAAELLKQFAPSENKRGRYLSDVILRLAQEAGLIEARQEPTVEDALAALKQQLAELEARVPKTRVTSQRGAR